MGIEDTLRKPIRIPYGSGHDVQPPRARVALRAQKLITAQAAAAGGATAVDWDAVVREMGVADDPSYDFNVDLFGAEAYEAMLDDLTGEEMTYAQQAMLLWCLPGITRDVVEGFLADPTVRAAPNRAARRKAAASAGAKSKSTGTK